MASPSLVRAAKAPLLCLIFIACIACLPGPAPAQDAPHNDWLGKLVAPISKDFRLHVEGEPPDPTDAYEVYKVQKVDGRRLCVADRTNGLPTWIPDSDVLPLDQAVERFSKQIEADPKDAFALAMRGVARLNLRKSIGKAKEAPDPDPVLLDFDKSIELDAQNPQLRILRADYWNSQAVYEKAIADLKAALTIDPKNTPALIALASAYTSKQEPDLAIEFLDRAIAEKPSAGLLAERGGLGSQGGLPESRGGFQRGRPHRSRQHERAADTRLLLERSRRVPEIARRRF